MLYLKFKRNYPEIWICVSNLKYEFEKATIDKFGKYIKDILYYISSNYTMIIDKREHPEDDVHNLFGELFTCPN